MAILKEYYFHKYRVTEQVFYKSAHCFALVNLKPIVPGHVLVVSNRVVPRLNDLTDEESIDYIRTVRKVTSFIEKYFKADSLNLAIQDGVYAGQSIPHLHTHVIPRHKANNMGDEIYDKIDEFNAAMRRDYLISELKKLTKNGESVDWVPKDEDRRPRTMEEMKKECLALQQSMEKL